MELSDLLDFVRRAKFRELRFPADPAIIPKMRDAKSGASAIKADHKI